MGEPSLSGTNRSRAGGGRVAWTQALHCQSPLTAGPHAHHRAGLGDSGWGARLPSPPLALRSGEGTSARWPRPLVCQRETWRGRIPRRTPAHQIRASWGVGGSDLLRAPETGLFPGRTDRRLPRPSRHPETQLLSDASVQSGTKRERGRTGGAHGSPEPRGGTGQALASALRGQWPILSGTQFQVPPRGCLVPCVSLGPAGLQKEAFGGEAARLRTALCSVAVGQGKFQRDVQVACGPG